MIQEIRLYKRYDTDLLALCDAGYSISLMIKDALYGYAHSTPVHIYIDQLIPFDLNKKTSVHTRFTIPDSDLQTCYLLRNIKHGYRNSFCKNVLRNALVQQNLVAYFADNSMLRLQSDNLQQTNLSALPNLKPCSSYIIGGKQESLFKEHTKQKKRKEEAYPPAFQNPYPMGAMPQFQSIPSQMQTMPGYPQPMPGFYNQPPQNTGSFQGNQNNQNQNWTYPNKNDINGNKKVEKEISNKPSPVVTELIRDTEPKEVFSNEQSHYPDTSSDPVLLGHSPAANNTADSDTSDVGISLAGDDNLLNIFDNI